MAHIYDDFTASIAISESLANKSSLGTSESIGLTDENIKAVSKTVTDSIFISADLANLVSRPVTDSITFADDFQREVEFARGLDDSISAVEAIEKAVSISVQDSISFQESITRIIGNIDRLKLFDSQIFTDEIIKRASIGRTDTFAIAEAIALGMGIRLSDSLNIAESKVASVVKMLSDSISIADSSTSPEPIWWGMIKWSCACHGGI